MHRPARRAAPARLIAASALVAVAVLAPLSAARAQGAVPETVITGGAISPSGLEAIRGLIAAQRAGLSNEDQVALRRARQAIAAPLRTPRITPEFRQAYAAELVPILRPMLADKRKAIAENALIIAGDLGTSSGVDMLVEGLRDPRSSIRAAAALGLRRTFVTCRESVPGILDRQAKGAIRAIETAMGTEDVPEVLDALAVALEGATQVPTTSLEGVREAAALALASSSSAALKRMGLPSEATFPLETRATSALFDLLQNRSIQLDAPTVVKIGALGGETLARVGCVLTGDGLSDEQRADLALIAIQSERVVIFAAERLGQPRAEARFGEAVQKSEHDRYRQELAKLTGAGGDLTKPPFSLTADRFKCP